MVLRAIKGKRPNFLESLAENHVLVVVLNAEIPPLDYARTAFQRDANSTTAEVTTFRTNTQACAIVSEVGWHFPTKSFNRRQLCFNRELA
jgi:hypothetical protein